MSSTEARYDLESDCLIVKDEGEKIKQSISLGNMTIDLDSQGRVIGVQILNASEIIRFSEEVEEPTEFLKDIEEAELDYRWFEDGSLVVTVEVFQYAGEAIQEGVINSTAPAVGLA